MRGTHNNGPFEDDPAMNPDQVFDPAAPGLESILFVQGDGQKLESVVRQLIAPTGVVEVRRDAPLKRHASAGNPMDQLIEVVEGNLMVLVGLACRSVGPGHLFLVPSGMAHTLQAGPKGATYVAALRSPDPGCRRACAA